ncbi:tetraspanin-8-related [Anaeramoeba ignava]|uniref:Tetraspanin-8-related n=1 Tax=Anaeramoeba ignava TaxID=1746090 RepID=A0A9Q0LBJ5_ANAIG|nr:tetraspanin-8-related [Anaeramoeba ignava]
MLSYWAGIHLVVGAILATIIAAPCIGVAATDRNKDCPKSLWTWVLICNIGIYVSLIPTLFGMFTESAWAYLVVCTIPILFLFIWAIIGLAWAKSDGVKDACGRLYDVTFGESIFLVIAYPCLIFLSYCGVLLVLNMPGPNG